MTKEQKAQSLTALISFSKSITFLEGEISHLPWDAEDELVILTGDQVSKVLQRFIANECESRDVERWANLLEAREDVSMDDTTRNVIYKLANPSLEGNLEPAVAQSLIEQLQRQA